MQEKFTAFISDFLIFLASVNNCLDISPIYFVMWLKKSWEETSPEMRTRNVVSLLMRINKLN